MPRPRGQAPGRKRRVAAVGLSAGCVEEKGKRIALELQSEKTDLGSGVFELTVSLKVVSSAFI